MKRGSCTAGQSRKNAKIIERTVPCPKCGAAIGERCWDSSRHFERMLAYDKAKERIREARAN